METPLQQWELDSLRASFAGTLMRTTAQWQRPVSVRTKGGQARSYLALANIDCTIEMAITNSREMESGSGQRAEQFWEITTAADLTVQPTDRFVVLVSGNVYEAVDGDGDPTNAFTNIIRCRRLVSFATPYLLPGTVSAVGTVKAAAIL